MSSRLVARAEINWWEIGARRNGGFLLVVARVIGGLSIIGVAIGIARNQAVDNHPQHVAVHGTEAVASSSRHEPVIFVRANQQEGAVELAADERTVRNGQDRRRIAED